MNNITLNSQQQKTLEIINRGDNIFLTGVAGSGKSTLLKHFISQVEKQFGPEVIGVTASTGKAAETIQGITIHSFLGLGIDKQFPDKYYQRIKDEVIKKVQKIKYLVIDEISMVNQSLFTMIDYSLKQIRFSRKPFGGVQLIICGDIFQLPPVITKEDQQFFQTGNLFFDSKSFQNNNFTICYLTENMRSGGKLDELLNLIRSQKDLLQCREIVETRNILSHPELSPSEGILKLCALNSQVDQYNYEQNPHHEKIGVGSKVMITQNDRSEERRYVNGTIGVVESIEGNFALVRKLEKSDGEENQDKNADENLVRVKRQILKLAYALTVHKAQGLTFDEPVLYDIEGTFESGQGYVGLSRATKLENLFISGSIQENPKLFDLNEKCKMQDQKFLEESEV